VVIEKRILHNRSIHAIFGEGIVYEWQYLYIDQIAVKKEYQRRGCGTRLLAEVFALARDKGIKTIALDTWSFNQQARSFLRKQGFSPFNERMWITDKQ
jgi:ribosomal protein S18 acetylase RimI-like enzyme